MDPLVTADKLSTYPGAPFAAPLVASASDHIRSIVEWHIAPVFTETRTLWCDGGSLFKLPTGKLDVDSPIEVSHGGRTSTAAEGDFDPDPAGMLFGRWPRGRLTVTFTHGYAECPQDLIPVIAELSQTFARDRTVKQESILSRSVAFGTPEGHSIGDVIGRYRL